MSQHIITVSSVAGASAAIEPVIGSGAVTARSRGLAERVATRWMAAEWLVMLLLGPAALWGCLQPQECHSQQPSDSWNYTNTVH